MNAVKLPQGFQLRHPTMDDLQGVTNLLIACDIADYGQPISAHTTIEEYTRSYWGHLISTLRQMPGSCLPQMVHMWHESILVYHRMSRR